MRGRTPGMSWMKLSTKLEGIKKGASGCQCKVQVLGYLKLTLYKYRLKKIKTSDCQCVSLRVIVIIRSFTWIFLTHRISTYMGPAQHCSRIIITISNSYSQRSGSPFYSVIFAAFTLPPTYSKEPLESPNGALSAVCTELYVQLEWVSDMELTMTFFHKYTGHGADNVGLIRPA